MSFCLLIAVFMAGIKFPEMKVYKNLTVPIIVEYSTNKIPTQNKIIPNTPNNTNGAIIKK